MLQRAPGTSKRFDYRIAYLREESTNALLMWPEAERYRMIAFVSGLAVLERPLSGDPRSN